MRDLDVRLATPDTVCQAAQVGVLQRRTSDTSPWEDVPLVPVVSWDRFKNELDNGVLFRVKPGTTLIDPVVIHELMKENLVERFHIDEWHTVALTTDEIVQNLNNGLLFRRKLK